jgi:polygalacturonase
MANCDGIDPDRCKNVRISNCHIVCADDCIVFKNTLAYAKYGPCENIVVNNCTLTSTSAAIKFGSESEDVFRNIFISNCTISHSNRGISLQLRDKGSIENVVFQNISINTRLFKKESFWGAAEPIAITALKRNESTEVGGIRNIHFNNIFCRSENGILIYADEHNLISDITFNNVLLSLYNDTKYDKGYHDLRPTIGDSFTKQDLCYVYANKASDISFKNCNFSIDDGFASKLVETFHLDDCMHFNI